MPFVVKRNKLTRRWRVLLVDPGNNEVLSVSETLNSVQAVDINIAAQRQASAEAEVIWP